MRQFVAEADGMFQRITRIDLLTEINEYFAHAAKEKLGAAVERYVTDSAAFDGMTVMHMETRTVTAPAMSVPAELKVTNGCIQKPRLELPELQNLTDAALDVLAAQRGLPSTEGLKIAASRGILHGQVGFDGEVQWVMTDDDRRHASRRNFSGLPFSDGQKAMALKGSTAGWPIGLADAQSRKRIVFCEGGPDALSAFTLLAMFCADTSAPTGVDDHGVVMMGGAACAICPDALSAKA